MAGVGIWVLSVRADTPPLDQLKPVKEGANSVVFAADGGRLGYIQSDTIRHPVSAKKIPQVLDHATVAIEDEHFYEHGGIDYGAIVRAGWEDLKAGAAVQGGSTITQQLVRNLYIADPEETIERKIREATWAEEYEQEYSKQQILTKYLNTASYGTTDGRTAVGVQAAAETYFSKPVSRLDLPEAALIAGLPQAPSEYNPFLNPKGAVARRNDVLQAMARQGYITQSEYEEALQAGLGLDRGRKYETIREPYFFDYVTQELIDKYGVNTVRNGGLKVYTTIDPELQAAAHQAIARPLDYPSGPATALVSIDPSNGHIVAMASSATYRDEQVQPRRPGSPAGRLLVQALRADGGDPPGHGPRFDLLLGQGPGHPDPGRRDHHLDGQQRRGRRRGDDERPRRHRAFGERDLRPARPRRGARGGPRDGLRHGHHHPPRRVPGRGHRRPADRGHAAGDGERLRDARQRRHPQHGDRDQRGRVPERRHRRARARSERTRAFSDGVAYEVTDVLKGVITSGTGTAASIGCAGQAGKTGTTDDYTDAWFVGYTPRFSTAVWVGYPDARTSMGSGAFGGTYAAPIWHDYMAGRPGQRLPRLPGAREPGRVLDLERLAHRRGAERRRPPTAAPPSP